jgi:hypothetical protein
VQNQKIFIRPQSKSTPSLRATPQGGEWEQRKSHGEVGLFLYGVFAGFLSRSLRVSSIDLLISVSVSLALIDLNTDMSSVSDRLSLRFVIASESF